MFIQRFDRGDFSSDPIAICCRPRTRNGLGGASSAGDANDRDGDDLNDRALGRAVDDRARGLAREERRSA